MPAKPNMTQIERDKLAIDPDLDFRDFGLRPFHDITTNEIGMFKWSGVYHQLQNGFFMIRLRIPGGVLSGPQLSRAGLIARTYGQDRLCITTRQCLQFHWLRMQDVHKVIEGMEEVGILSKNACGDVTRNVVTCPLAGVCPHELADTPKVLTSLADDDELLNQQRNLPRKQKISVAGCGRACGQTLMNCQSWYPVRRVVGGNEETGWRFLAGGGLGPRPRMADVIFDWVPEELVVEVSRAATEAYRRHGDRRNRYAARLKLVVETMGAGGFAQCLLGIMRERGVDALERIVIAHDHEAAIGTDFLEGQAVIEQRDGRHAVRVRIPRGELRSADAFRLSEWARHYGDGSLVLTNRQNLILRNITDKEALITALSTCGYLLDGMEQLPDAVACVGTSACPLAVSDTPNVYRMITSELAADESWWRSIGPLKINMNGCPNSCAQHACVDIGLRGTRHHNARGSDEGYSIYLGGSLAGKGKIADYVCDVATTNVVPALRRILNHYLATRRDEAERFSNFVERVGALAFRQKLKDLPTSTPANIRNIDLRPAYRRALDEFKTRRRQVIHSSQSPKKARLS